jgi:hypothetical protein
MSGLMTALLLAAWGCGEPAERPEAVPLDQVPAPALKTAGEALPGIKLNSAFKITVNGETAYEIRGKDKRGKIREAEVSASGKLLETE